MSSLIVENFEFIFDFEVPIFLESVFNYVVSHAKDSCAGSRVPAMSSVYARGVTIFLYI